ncbi:MAG: hypothetical protein PHR47_00650 [Candidatus Pacebacteria bacterium]|nr:hypothetical protein [Candidatus Paceibacterota bacterium]
MTSEYLIILANGIIITSLFPSIFGEDKPALGTSILQFLVCIIFILAYIELELFLAIIANIIMAICWLILIFQKIKFKS